MTEQKKKLTRVRVPQEAQGLPKESEKKKRPERVNIGITVNKALWRRFRAVAIRTDVNAGDLLDSVIEDYLKDHEYDG